MRWGSLRPDGWCWAAANHSHRHFRWWHCRWARIFSFASVSPLRIETLVTHCSRAPWSAPATCNLSDPLGSRGYDLTPTEGVRPRSPTGVMRQGPGHLRTYPPTVIRFRTRKPQLVETSEWSGRDQNRPRAGCHGCSSAPRWRQTGSGHKPFRRNLSR